MQIRFFTIAKGNKTALIWGCPQERQHAVALEHLQSGVEQVGFVVQGENLELVMMGKELCINALLALAFSEKNTTGTISIQKKSSVVSYTNTPKTTSITLSLPYIRDAERIIFEQIGYVCTKNSIIPNKETFRDLAQLHNVPAFGVISYNAQMAIVPVVYVCDTNSMIHETACGSGSIAVHILTGNSDIVQPTGEIISIQQHGVVFTIHAEVVECA